MTASSLPREEDRDAVVVVDAANPAAVGVRPPRPPDEEGAGGGPLEGSSSSSSLSSPSLSSSPSSDAVDAADDSDSAPPVPSWADDDRRSSWGEPLVVKEWEESPASAGYREANGWKGTDLIHSPSSPVRIFSYAVRYGDWDPPPPGREGDAATKPPRRGGPGTTLTGAVLFTAAAESHAGYCHGGSMCSVMDDVIGWTGFLVTGQCRPWSGFTVQVNTSMRRPVPVGSYLKIRATIVKVERRKVHVRARLVDPASSGRGGGGGSGGAGGGKGEDREEEGCLHAEADGIVVLKRGVLPGED